MIIFIYFIILFISLFKLQIHSHCVCSVERQMIHNIMGASQLKRGGSTSYNLKTLSLNVVSISEAELSSTETNSMIKIEVPQVHKL